MVGPGWIFESKQDPLPEKIDVGKIKLILPETLCVAGGKESLVRFRIHAERELVQGIDPVPVRRNEHPRRFTSKIRDDQKRGKMIDLNRENANGEVPQPL